MHLDPVTPSPSRTTAKSRQTSRHPFHRIWPTAALCIFLAACGGNPSKTSSTTADDPSALSAEATPTASATDRQRPPAVPYSARSLSGDYSGYASAVRLIERLEQEEGFDREYLYGVFSRLERQQWILDYMNRPRSTAPPGPGSWNRYRAKFITPAHIQRGLDFWRDNAATLKRAEARYGVPAEYMVAIIGVETHYGRYFGSHSVIDALATLAFDYPRRADFFTDELAAYMVMTRNEGMDPLKPIGSYAGAMGLGQFMPSSFLKYAVDFDGDGVRDLWNPVDAIGSVANYFRAHGWRTGEPVAFPAVARGREAEIMDAGFSSRYSAGSLATRGVTSRVPLDADDEVSLLRLNAAGGQEYWIGLHNFYVISRYNHSTYYSMAVYQLAQELKSRAPSMPAGTLMSRAPGAGTLQH